MSSVLGLPPLPPPLRSVSPYLKHAEELESQDPIMAFWCKVHSQNELSCFSSPTRRRILRRTCWNRTSSPRHRVMQRPRSTHSGARAHEGGHWSESCRRRRGL